MRYVAKMDRFGREISVNKLTDEEGYLHVAQDFDTLTGRQNLYLSLSVLLQEVARGNVPGLALAERVDELEDGTVDLQDQLERAVARANEAEAKLGRIQGLSKDGFRVTRQQGRPPKQKVAG